MISTQEILVRLLAALLFCGVVGLQRALTGKAAGMRTHILVGVGAAIFTIISGYAFGTTASNADRIAAQIVSGIGFIGGGAILKEGGSIKGLTTAAGLWTAAALGMAAGAGMYVLGAIGAAIILLTLVVLRRVEIRFPRRAMEPWTIVVTLDDDAALSNMYGIIAPQCHKVSLVALQRNEHLRATLIAEMPRRFNILQITAQLQGAGARTVTWQVAGDADVDTEP